MRHVASAMPTVAKRKQFKLIYYANKKIGWTSNDGREK